MFNYSRAGAILAATSMLALVAGAGQAATIDSWNTSNVDVGDPVSGVEADESVIYDRAYTDPDAVTNGKIVYAAPEANEPGLRVSQTDFSQSKTDFDGCILASSATDCDGDFQSGKRFKLQATDTGPIDLVFDVTDGGEDSVYRVFQRVINETGAALSGFTIELGTGVGTAFKSAAGDGLSFATEVNLGPEKLPSFSQYPFGLFGSLDQANPNPLGLPGFFDTTSRAGFDVVQTEDMIKSTGFYGSYDDLFGNWLSQDDVPLAKLWDYADGDADPLVMAWDTGDGWEVRRGIDPSLDGETGVSEFDVFALAESEWKTFAYDDEAGLIAFLSGIPLIQDYIEDLQNLNLNFAIALGSNFTGDSFTLRTTVAPVPLPAGAPLLLAGLGAFALVRRKRRAAA